MISSPNSGPASRGPIPRPSTLVARPALSPRETQILELFDSGLSYKEIADRLDCSFHTVKAHARNILVKTLAHSLREAAWRQRDHTNRSSGL